MGSEGGFRGWVQRVGPEGGSRGWVQRVGPEGGFRGLVQRVGPEGGFRGWVQGSRPDRQIHPWLNERYPEEGLTLRRKEPLPATRTNIFAAWNCGSLGSVTQSGWVLWRTDPGPARETHPTRRRVGLVGIVL